MKKEIDFLALIIDVANYATPSLIDLYDKTLTKNDVVEKFAISWATTIKEKFEYEAAAQWSARYYELIKNYCNARIMELAEMHKPNKVAKLVSFHITTRVVVNKNEMPEVEEEDAIQKALEKLNANPSDYLIQDNFDDCINDDECPFGTFEEDLIINNK